MDNLTNNSNWQEKLPIKLKSLLLLLVLLLAWQTVSSLVFPKAVTEASDLTMENIVSAVSRERILQNLTALKTDTRLSFAAQYKANDMMSRHYFSHADPESAYIWNKIVQAGYTPYLQLGENLAIEFYNTESLISAWMNSPTHRANILNENFQDQGAGLAFGIPDQGQYYSAIANTFGALVPVKKTSKSPPPQSPQPSSQSVKPILSQPKNEPPVKKLGIAIPTGSEVNANLKAPAANPPAEPLRSSTFAQNFTLPQESPATTVPDAVKTPSAAITVPAFTAPRGLTSYEINRYLMLGFALILILMAASDLKKIFKEKLHSYDKKINNLVLLILSLLVIGLMYWL